jgi:hypothetical protein
MKQSVELYDFYQKQISACDLQIEDYLIQFDSKLDLDVHPIPPTKRKHRRPKGNEPHFDLRTHLYRITGVDFTQIDGLNDLSVQTIIPEVGLDPGAFPTAKHFTSWLGLCPNNRITGGNTKSSNTQKLSKEPPPLSELPPNHYPPA